MKRLLILPAVLLALSGDVWHIYFPESGTHRFLLVELGPDTWLTPHLPCGNDETVIVE